MAAKRRPRLPVRRPRPSGGIAATLRLFGVLLLAALLIRSLLIAPFNIPSGSMLPGLRVGDYLLVAKWPYGWSRHSFPLSVAPIAGRWGNAAPARGDVVVFRTPADDRTDYVKRLIGLPGDRIRMAGGAIVLNGVAVPRLRVADLLLPAAADGACPDGPGKAARREAPPQGLPCRYRRYRETLPGGRSYDVLDLGQTAGDDTAEVVVPPGRYFLLGDNRDRSADSRFPAEPSGGIGFVPAENLVGRAWLIFFSTDGSGRWLRPWTWPGATRWDRIGERANPTP